MTSTVLAPASIDSNNDTLDVRDIIARVEHLEQLEQPGPVDLGDEDNEMAQDDLFAELRTLRAFLEELCGNGGDEQWRGDWYPVSLIRESHFEDYCRDLVADIGDMPRNLPSYIAIDWSKTADNLRVDYSEAEFDGVSYLYR